MGGYYLKINGKEEGTKISMAIRLETAGTVEVWKRDTVDKWFPNCPRRKATFKLKIVEPQLRDLMRVADAPPRRRRKLAERSSDRRIMNRLLLEETRASM